MSGAAALTEALVRMVGSNERAADELKVSTATIIRWRAGKGNPQPSQERKLRGLIEGRDSDQLTLLSTTSAEASGKRAVQIENVIRSLLNEFREILHRHAKFSHRNDSLDFLAKIIFAHITDKESGGMGVNEAMFKYGLGPSSALKNFVESQLKQFLPKSLSYEIDTLSKTLFLTEKDDEFTSQVIKLFSDKIINDVLSSVISSHRMDVINDIFGRFVTDSFVEEKEMGQYLTPPEVVRLMSLLGASSLPENIISELTDKHSDLIILDPSCGVGSFLVEGIHAVATYSRDPELAKVALQSRIVGIDKSERMAQLAITNLALLGAKEANIVLANGLDRRKQQPFGNLDGRAALILTNPPFGASFADSEIGEYNLFDVNERVGSRIDSELLFLERYVDWLCPGGVLVAIIPDSVLTNQGLFKKTRQYLSKHCDVLSVISLPPVTFAAAGTTTKTSILHLQKKQKAQISDLPKTTYFAVCEQVGYEVVTRGAQRRRVINSKNQLPEIIQEAVRSRPSTFGRITQFDVRNERWDAKFNLTIDDEGQDESGGAKRVRVGDIAALVSEKVDPRRLPNDEFDYIEISDVDDRLGMVWSKRTSAVSAPSRARKRVRAGDILMSTVRPERGCVGVVPKHLDGAICSTGFAVMRTKTVNPYLVAFLLKSPKVIAQVERYMSGIAYPAINENLIPELMLSVNALNSEKNDVEAAKYKALAEQLGSQFLAITEAVNA